MHSLAFESGAIRARLTRADRAILHPFRCTEKCVIQADAAKGDIGEEGSFVEQQQQCGFLTVLENKYNLLLNIPPTSNMLSGSLVFTRTTYGQGRYSLQPITPEVVIFFLKGKQQLLD